MEDDIYRTDQRTFYEDCWINLLCFFYWWNLYTWEDNDVQGHNENHSMQEEEDNNAEKQYCPYMGLAALLFIKLWIIRT